VDDGERLALQTNAGRGCPVDFECMVKGDQGKIIKTWNIVGHTTGNQDNKDSDIIIVLEVVNQPDEGLEDDEPGGDFIL
jgi:hypothetical protein